MSQCLMNIQSIIYNINNPLTKKLLQNKTQTPLKKWTLKKLENEHENRKVQASSTQKR
jgi:hypothetical protein